MLPNLGTDPCNGTFSQQDLIVMWPNVIALFMMSALENQCKADS